MPSAPTLRATQLLLKRLITAPEGAAAGVAELQAHDPPSAAMVDDLITGDERLSAVERIDVYANMYFYRLLDSLKEDYPAVHRVGGDVEFHNLITDYLIVHAPQHHSLRYAGQHLPAFLLEHRLSGRWPFLPSLARLEWAILESFDAPDSLELSAEDLDAIPAQRWSELRFVPAPSLQLLELDWDVQEVWAAGQGGEAVPTVPASPSALKVWRQNLRVFHRPLTGLERDCLECLLRREPFAVWCERAVGSLGEEEAPPAVLDILRRWLDEGVLAAVEY